MLTDNLLMDNDLVHNENIIIKNNNFDNDADVDNNADNRLCHADIAFQMKRLIIQGRCSLTDNCMICLENMHRSKCIYLPCKHAFHSTCLKQLVERRTYTCPLCRAEFKETLAVLGIPREEDDGRFEIIFTIQNELADALLEWLRQSYEGEYEILE